MKYKTIENILKTIIAGTAAAYLALFALDAQKKDYHIDLRERMSILESDFYNFKVEPLWNTSQQDIYKGTEVRITSERGG